jgi:hypothetical protein
VKYAYQESPHSETTATTRSEKEERKREHVFFIRISILNKTTQTINEKWNPWVLPSWNCQWQNKLPLGD